MHRDQIQSEQLQSDWIQCTIRPILCWNRGSAASEATANAVDAAHSVPSKSLPSTPSLDGRDVMRILHSFRQFVVHHDKSRTLKNAVISVWAQIGNILALETAEQHQTQRHYEKTPALERLQDVLGRHPFYSTICLFGHIYGAPKGLNVPPDDGNSRSLFLPISDSRSVRWRTTICWNGSEHGASRWKRAERERRSPRGRPRAGSR